MWRSTSKEARNSRQFGTTECDKHKEAAPRYRRKINHAPWPSANCTTRWKWPGAGCDSATSTGQKDIKGTGPRQAFGKRVAKESPQRPEESLSRPPPPAAAGGERAKGGGGDSYLGMVMHLVLGSWLAMAFSSSSRPPDFLSFLTRLRTAFSLHLSSHSPFFQPRSRFTIGGENGSIDDISAWTRPALVHLHRRIIRRHFGPTHATTKNTSDRSRKHAQCAYFAAADILLANHSSRRLNAPRHKVVRTASRPVCVFYAIIRQIRQ